MKPMNANAFRHFYNYHFDQNRTLREDDIVPLPERHFTQDVGYLYGSLRAQFVHMMSADQQWFCELREEEIPGPLDPVEFSDRQVLRDRWNQIEQMIRDYFELLQDDTLFTRPFPGEAKDLVVWQVLLHVLNHGTDHRVQLLRMPHDFGMETGPQDYIFFAFNNRYSPISRGNLPGKPLRILNGSWDIVLFTHVSINNNWTIKI
jgi:uncharacterized damage-inducible protein DinB